MVISIIFTEKKKEKEFKNWISMNRLGDGNDSAKKNCIINFKHECYILITHFNWRFESLNKYIIWF